MFNMDNGYGCGLDLDGWLGVQHIYFAIHLSQYFILYKICMIMDKTLSNKTSNNHILFKIVDHLNYDRGEQALKEVGK